MVYYYSEGKENKFLTMKRFLYFICLLTLCLSPRSAACADDEMTMTDQVKVSDEMINVLVKELLSLFPINSQKEYFSDPAEDLYSDDGPNTVIQIGTDRGKQHVALYTNTDTVKDHTAYVPIDTGYFTDFQFSMDVTVDDVFPSGEGGCFIGFTNYGITAFNEKQDPVSVSLVLNSKGTEVYAKHKYQNTGDHYQVNTNSRMMSKLTVIHLRNHTYLFVDGVYAGQFHDGKDGPFRLIYGSYVYANGETASCYFDNLLIKKVSSEW